MKVIDLLNKIANEEKVPEKIIKNNGMIYEFHKNSNNYYEIENYEEPLFNEDITIFLNDEVEIIEEEKKIPEKEDELIGYNIQEFDNLKEFVEITTNDVFGKINKIINKQNKIIDYLKSKGE